VSPLRVKLVGFEASQLAINSRLKISHETISYSAPEMLGCLKSVHQPEREYRSAVDIWALGCLVHEILTGETLFLDHDFAGTVEGLNLLANDMPHLKILTSFCLEEFPLPTEKLKQSGADTEAIDFIKQLLVAQPDSRPSAMEALDHVWLLGCRSYEKFKLETTISEGGVVHTTLGATNEAITTEWADVRVIGRGGFGTVSLQKGVVRGLECGFRAVKRVHKDFHKLGLSREVSAMIAVKDVRTPTSILCGYL
jgi:serine/threonine protein kinase